MRWKPRGNEQYPRGTRCKPAISHCMSTLSSFSEDPNAQEDGSFRLPNNSYMPCSREYILRCASFFPFFSGAGIISTLFRPLSRAVTHMVETSNRTGVSALHIHLRLRGIATLGKVMYCTYSRYMYSAGSKHCDPEVRRVSEVGPRGRLLATIPPMLETESGIFSSNKYYRSIPVVLA